MRLNEIQGADERTTEMEWYSFEGIREEGNAVVRQPHAFGKERCLQLDN